MVGPVTARESSNLNTFFLKWGRARGASSWYGSLYHLANIWEALNLTFSHCP